MRARSTAPAAVGGALDDATIRERAVGSLAGDVALVTASWQLAMTGPDGKPAEMSGQSLEVVRRQPGGGWLFVIDEPFGAGA